MLLIVTPAVVITSFDVVAAAFPSWTVPIQLLLVLGQVLLVLFGLIFPNGQLAPRWALIFPVIIPIMAVFSAFNEALQQAPLFVLIYFSLLIALFAVVIYRYQRLFDRTERQQTKWVLWGMLIFSMGAPIWGYTFVFSNPAPGQARLLTLLGGWTLSMITLLAFPTTIFVAILRYRLWDIDFILNRTLVYGGLTGLVTAVYLLIIGGMGTLVANQSGTWIGLVLATAIVVWGIRPLRRRWQTAVSRYIPLPNPPPHQEMPASERRDGKTAVRPWHMPLAALLFLLVLGGVTAFVFLSVSVCRDYSSLNIYRLAGLIGPAGGLAFATVGLIILYKHPANRIGWLCSLGGLGLALNPVLDVYISCALAGRISPIVLPLTAWFVYTILPLTTILTIFIFLPLWFPDGRFLTRRWRRVGLTMLMLMSILTLAVTVTPTFRQNNSVATSYPLENPMGLAWLPAWWGPFFASALNLLMIFGSLGAVTSMILRFKRAAGDERQQMKLFAYWTTAVIFQLVVFELILYRFAPLLEDTTWFDWIEFAYGLNLIVVFLGFPLIIGIAIFKYRLYDIDVIVNRTLVYGGLSLGVVAVYALVVGALGALFQSQGSFLFALLATGLIAVLFQPVRERLQRGVNRLMFGERDDPYAVLSKLSTLLQTTVTPQAMLQSVVETITTSLKLPYAAIELVDEQGRLEAAKKGEVTGDTVELPLRYQNETIGYLVVSTRSPGESFTERERRLLADIAAQTGAVASSVRLMAALQRSAADLQQSREKLVLTREEERRRIRRDLHDGLGPTLASQTFTMDAILKRLETAPQEAAALLHDLKAQNKETVTEIRRLVYELRPPVLDELGLLDALKAHVAQINNPQSLQISVTAHPEPLPALSAAVEVAAYRIVLEAITNVLRHAEAKQCKVHLRVTENGRSHLQIEVCDDGKGLPVEMHAGVGFHSIRERAEELGGSLIVKNMDKGTQLTARLPLALSRKSHE